MSNGNQYNSSTIHAPAPLVNIQMAMPDNNSHNNAIMPMMSGVNSMLSNVNSGLPNPFTPPPVVPNIADLADMYNNTIAAASTTEMGSETGSGDTNSHNANESSSSKEPAIHVPEDPASYLPSIFIKEEPPHGCLKQGKKPTFREWANKMLKKPVDAIKEMFGGESGDGIDSENVAGGSGGGDGGGSSNGGAKKLNDNSSNENTTGMRVKIRKTLKKKFRVGKHDNVVGVLLKNKEAQRHIQKQHLTLKQKSIGDIKKHLYDKNLLKIGSNAPPDVLRRLYEDSILTGDVKNTSSTVLLHNFFSNDA